MRFFTLCILLLALAGAGASLSGCSDDTSPLDGSDKPCGIEPGLYANIAGTAEAVVICVPDDRIEGTVDTGVHTTYSGQSERYLISAIYTAGSTTHEIDISFMSHLELPAVLIVTANAAQAQLDSNFVWVSYQVTEAGDSTFFTTSASGTLNLAFNSPEIVVATFNNIELHLTDSHSQPASLIRAISEGYINLTTDPF
jgi:hypothetical protein